jgi:aspartate 1-decarboxylase
LNRIGYILPGLGDAGTGCSGLNGAAATVARNGGVEIY